MSVYSASVCVCRSGKPEAVLESQLEGGDGLRGGTGKIWAGLRGALNGSLPVEKKEAVQVSQVTSWV
jgi:hypothetical protein